MRRSVLRPSVLGPHAHRCPDHFYHDRRRAPMRERTRAMRAGEKIGSRSRGHDYRQMGADSQSIFPRRRSETENIAVASARARRRIRG